MSKIIIHPVGLLNLSRVDKKKKKKYYKNNNESLYNTCYINSSIQCLFRLNGFINKILYSTGKELTEATNKLINAMMCKKNISKNLRVLEIKQAMAKIYEKYKDNNPEDANEFISNYLNALHEENMNKYSSFDFSNIQMSDNDKENFMNFFKKFYGKKGESFIFDIFYGILRTESYCKKCKYQFSVKFHAYNILEIPIYNLINNNNEVLNMNKILKQYISPKEVEHSTCSVCQIDTFIKTEFFTFPKCLIIYFERNDEKKYIDNDINILETINLDKYLYNPSTNSSKYNYTLKGVIYYDDLGDNLGHYTATCLIEYKWYYFDDNEIYEQENLKNINDYEKPVLLFYENEKEKE